jgi:hemerythrin-like domain-containing protein
MGGTPFPSAALRELLHQHDELRQMIDTCLALVDRLEGGAAVAGDLAQAIARLRIAFEAHNRHEEALLRPVLIAADAFGAVRVDQMIEEHVEEHRVVRQTLASIEVDGLVEILTTLRTHLEEEERWFLSPRVVRDDVVSVEGSE